MDRTCRIIFCIRYSRFFWVNLKKNREKTIMIYLNKIESRIMFEIKTGCYLKLLTYETIELLESTKSKTTKDENDENVPHL